MEVPEIDDSVTARCNEMIDILSARLATVIANRQNLVHALEFAQQNCAADIKKLHGELEDKKHQVLELGRSMHCADLKKLDISADELVIMASQMRTCAGMCSISPHTNPSYIQRMIASSSSVLHAVDGSA